MIVVPFSNYGNDMRGGKREGAGRKTSEETVRLRVPIGALNEVKALIERYKDDLLKTVPKINTTTGQKSKEPINTGIPILNDDQKKRFQSWLTRHGYAKNISETIRMTKTPELCRHTFIKYRQYADEYEMINIHDIVDLYDASGI